VARSCRTPPFGRDAMCELLRRKWTREVDYLLIKELRPFSENRVAVRLAYEWPDDSAASFAATAMRTGSSMIMA